MAVKRRTRSKRASAEAGTLKLLGFEPAPLTLTRVAFRDSIELERFRRVSIEMEVEVNGANSAEALDFLRRSVRDELVQEKTAFDTAAKRRAVGVGY